MLNLILAHLKEHFWLFPVYLLAFLYARYFLFSYLGYVILWRKLGPALEGRRIQTKPLLPGQLRREIRNSLVSFIPIAIAGWGVYYCYLRGWTAVYTDWNERSAAWIPAGLVIFFFWHDCYFYWSHRLLHLSWFFRKVHFVHHQSGVPTPCASHCIHWGESLMQFGATVPVIFLVPMHPYVLTGFLAVTHFFATWGHFNYELMPFGTWHAWWGSWVTTSTHHNHHHSSVNGNFGLYLKAWDVRFGTLLRKTPEHFDRIRDEKLRSKKSISPSVANADAT